MLLVGLLLLTSQLPAADTAERTRSALIAAKVEMQNVDVCRPSARQEALGARYRSLHAEAAGLIPVLGPNVGEVLAGPRCRRDTMRRATASLDRLAAILPARRAAMRGLWLGPLHLCAGTVQAIEEGKDEQQMPRILIRFAPAMAEAVRTETTKRVNAQLPILLDGRTLTAPVVREPITGGEISIAGPDPVADFDGGVPALREGAARPCQD